MSVQPDTSADLTRQALVTAAMADGPSTIAHAPPAEEFRELLDALDGLGTPARYDPARQRFDVIGRGGHWPMGQADLHFHRDTAAMHLMAAACCIGTGQYRIDADSPLRDQPVRTLADALIDLGAAVAYEDRTSHPPLTLRATGLPGGNVRLAPERWAIRALLLACPLARTDVFIELTADVNLSPTHALMQAFGVQVIAGPHGRLIVPAHQRYRPTRYEIPPE